METLDFAEPIMMKNGLIMQKKFYLIIKGKFDWIQRESKTST